MSFNSIWPGRTRFRREWCFALAGATAVGVIIGCGGGGGGGGGGTAGSTAGSTSGGNNTKVLTGANLDIAIGVTNAKATAAGSAVPFMLLKQVTPTFIARPSRDPVKIDALGLWVTSKTLTGGDLETDYFTTANASVSSQVGAIKIHPTGTAPAITYTAVGQITGGNIPMTLNNPDKPLKIAFTDKVANTMTGELVLPQSSTVKQQITLDLNLNMNDSHQVGGGVTVVYTYQADLGGGFIVPIGTTTTLSGISGTVDSISGAASVSADNPLGGAALTATGTGTLNLDTGDFTLTLTAGDPTLLGLTAKTNPVTGVKTHQLTVTGPAGLNKVIADPNTFNIGTLLTAATGGTGGKGYQTPLVLSASGATNVTVSQAIGDGQMVGYGTNGTKQTPLYWAQPGFAPTPLGTPPSGNGSATAYGIASYSGQTVIVGSYVTPAGKTQPLFWIRSSGSDNFKPTVATSLQNGGEFRAISANGNYIVGWQYDSSFIQKPLAYVSGTPYALLTDGRQTNLRAIGVSNDGTVLGEGDGPDSKPGLWQKISVDTASNSIKTTFHTLPYPNGFSSGYLSVFHISPTGVVAGGDGSKALFWSPDGGYGPDELNKGSNVAAQAYAVNDAGTQFAGSIILTTAATEPDLAVWPSRTAAAVDIESKVPNALAYSHLSGFFLLNDGSLVCLATVNSKVDFLYIQFKK